MKHDAEKNYLTVPAARGAARNRFDRWEWAGACGDLGTLIPFVAGYIAVTGMDPFGVLFAFGLAMVGVGLYYGTPFPVQPMKAVGAAATTQTNVLTLSPNAIYGAGLLTGIIWLILGMTGVAKRLVGLVSPAVAGGMVLGLGLALMLAGIKLMSAGWLLGGLALVGALFAQARPLFPAMFALLLCGAIVALAQDPGLLGELRAIEAGLRVPTFALGDLTWAEFLTGALILALPQLPLTLGNAVIAVTHENNRLFPERPVNAKTVAISTGCMNLASAAVGGVPMCHGVGGMAGHVQFGARTGGAPIILGVLLLILAVFFSGSIQTLFKIFPAPILGVILFLAGAQLARGGIARFGTGREPIVLIATAAFALWNVGVAFVVGMALDYAIKRGWGRT